LKVKRAVFTLFIHQKGLFQLFINFNWENRFSVELNYEKTAVFIVKSGSFASDKGGNLKGENDG